jgi:hypothetical protein
MSLIPSDTPTSYYVPNAAPSVEAFGGALVAATVSTVTFTKVHAGISITNVGGSAAINYTLDGSTPAAGTAPVLDAVVGAHVIIPFDAEDLVVVKLLSTGTPTYNVVGLDVLELQEDALTPDTTL